MNKYVLPGLVKRRASLAGELTETGLAETEGPVTVKINRGAYPAWFLFAVMKAIGAREVRLD